MSFKQNNTVTLSNYEEYFVLYMDNELDASQKAMVEAFVAQHPQLGEELESLVSLKLPLDRISFSGKEELLSPAMKLNAVDESLLLYIDSELSPAEKASVEERLASDEDYAKQHALLRQTKLNGEDVIPHPAKKELYRHERRTVPFGFWLRMAAAVILLLIGTWFFVLNKGKRPEESTAGRRLPIKSVPALKEEPTIVEQGLPKSSLPKEETALLKQTAVTPVKKGVKAIKQTPPEKQQNDVVSSGEKATAAHRRETIRIEASRFTREPKIGDAIAFNEPVTHTSVTSLSPGRTTPVNPDGAIAADWDFKDTKKTPARGFFRKVSRFIERNTGIGTVNADNELLVGAVALKLK